MAKDKKETPKKTIKDILKNVNPDNCAISVTELVRGHVLIQDCKTGECKTTDDSEEIAVAKEFRAEQEKAFSDARRKINKPKDEKATNNQ